MNYTEYSVDSKNTNIGKMVDYKQNELNTNKNSTSQTSINISGNTALIQKYNKYCEKCKAKNKKPVPMTTWLARKGFAAAAGLGAAGITGAVAYSKYKKKTIKK